MADWIGYIYEQDLTKLFTLSHSNQEYRLITPIMGYIYPQTFTGVIKLSYHIFTLLINDYFTPNKPKEKTKSLEINTINNYIKI